MRQCPHTEEKARRALHGVGGETHSHGGGPITAPTSGPGRAAPQPARAAVPILCHFEVGTHWGSHLPPHPLLPPQWLAAGCSLTGGMPTTSSAAMPPTRTPAGGLCPPTRVTPLLAAPSLLGRCLRRHFTLMLSPLHTMSIESRRLMKA